MSYADLEERYDGFYAPVFRLRFGGRTGASNDYTFPDDGPQVRETNGLVSGLSIESTLDGADRFSCTLVGVYDLEEAKFDERVWNQFAPETAVRIEIGYTSKLVPVLEGRIQSLRPEFPESGLPTIEVSGFDRLHDMTKSTREDHWSGARLNQVVDDVVTNGEYGYTTQTQRNIVDLTEITSGFREIKQEKQSDFDFLDQWAKRYNYELFVHIVPESMNSKRDIDATIEPNPETDETYEVRFNFRPPADTEETAAWTLRYGESLRSFSVEVNEASQQSSVTVRHWDTGGRRRRPIVGRYAEDEEGREITADPEDTREISVPVESPEQARLAARAAYQRNNQQRVTGRGEVIGLPTLRVGQVVDLQRLSTQVNAKYYVTSVTHRVDESGYTTSFGVRLAARERINLT
jgi:phage protein D